MPKIDSRSPDRSVASPCDLCSRSTGDPARCIPISALCRRSKRQALAQNKEEFFPPRRNILTGGHIFLFCRVRQLYGGGHRDGEAACVARVAGRLHWAFSL